MTCGVQGPVPFSGSDDQGDHGQGEPSRLCSGPSQPSDGKEGRAVTTLTPQSLKTDRSHEPRSLEVHCACKDRGLVSEEGASAGRRVWSYQPSRQRRLWGSPWAWGRRVSEQAPQAREGCRSPRLHPLPLSPSPWTDDTQSVTSADSMPSASVC